MPGPGTAASPLMAFPPSPTLPPPPQLGMDGVFVGSGIFKSGDPAKRARAIVQVRGSKPSKRSALRAQC